MIVRIHNDSNGYISWRAVSLRKTFTMRKWGPYATFDLKSTRQRTKNNIQYRAGALKRRQTYIEGMIDIQFHKKGKYNEICDK